VDIEIVWAGQAHAYFLDDGEHSVGRASDNDVQISFARVSKRHAHLRVSGETLYVRDDGSSNGTEVNGLPIGREDVEVPPGTIVSFAGALLRRPGTHSSVRHTLLGDERVSTRMRYRAREGYSDAARERILGQSAGLFELLASGDSAEQVGEAACRFVSQCVHADRVVLLEDEGEGTSLENRAHWTRRGDPDAPLHLSGSIVSGVVSDRESILVANPAHDPRFEAQQSIVSLNLRSAMAAPLFDNERVRGIFYVDTSQSGVEYSRADLEVLTAVSNAVAVKLKNLTFEREMRTAARIQRSMLPDHLDVPDGYEVDAYQSMCRSVGGDLYALLPRASGNVLIALGDVSGKGMSAALAMGAATVLLGLLADIEGDVERVATLLHRQLFRSLAEEQFITFFIGELNPATGTLHYVNAGHEPPLIARASGDLDALAPTGLPVALIEDPMLSSSTARLEAGDVMAVFSDGIPEATTHGDEFLGSDAMETALREGRGGELAKLRGRVVVAVEEFLDGAPASDDVTLLLLRRTGE